MAKSPATLAALVEYFVHGTDGSIDITATLAAIEADVLELVVEHESKGERLLTGINAAFDAHPGESMSTDYVITEALRLMGATSDPKTYASTKKELAGFIKANHQGEKLADGTWERPNSLFVSNKGRAVGGGTLGLQRRSDLK